MGFYGAISSPSFLIASIQHFRELIFCAALQESQLELVIMLLRYTLRSDLVMRRNAQVGAGPVITDV